jgi:hypothetical protein
MRRLLAAVAAVLAGAGVLLAWPVTSSYVGLNSPDPTAHAQTLARPFSVFGWTWNDSRAIDFYEIWLIHDANGNGVVDQAEYDGRVVIHRQPDFNVPNRENQRLTRRGAINAGNTTNGEKYFLFL